ncbi:hypothetical protein Tco_0231173 [Tanacetum coccineum]
MWGVGQGMVKLGYVGRRVLDWSCRVESFLGMMNSNKAGKFGLCDNEQYLGTIHWREKGNYKSDRKDLRRWQTWHLKVVASDDVRVAVTMVLVEGGDGSSGGEDGVRWVQVTDGVGGGCEMVSTSVRKEWGGD